MKDKTENRGGKRKGAGRKALLELAGESRSEIIETFKKAAEKHDTTFGKELANMVFGKRKEKRLKMQAMQLFVRDVLPKVSERETTTTTILKPQIYLPVEFEDADVPDFKPH